MVASLLFIYTPHTHVGGCQNYGPFLGFLGTLNIRCRIIIGIRKGPIVLTTTHVLPVQKGSPIALSKQNGLASKEPFLCTSSKDTGPRVTAWTCLLNCDICVDVLNESASSTTASTTKQGKYKFYVTPTKSDFASLLYKPPFPSHDALVGTSFCLSPKRQHGALKLEVLRSKAKA